MTAPDRRPRTDGEPRAGLERVTAARDVLVRVEELALGIGAIDEAARIRQLIDALGGGR